MSKSRLGKGLEALIPQMADVSSDAAVNVSLAELRPNPYQPRQTFDEEKLQELASSIKEHGVIQPIIVRRSLAGYEVVAGERRMRAAKMAGLSDVPVVVREFSDQDLMEIALIENVQREDLSPIEVAEAYTQLAKRFRLTQEELAQKVGQSRSHVANIMRLLQLPQKVRDDVSRGTLSMGHARALLSVEKAEQQLAMAREIVENDLSVRTVEQRVAQLSHHVPRETSPKKFERNPILTEYETRFRERLGTSVRITSKKKRGIVEIDYFSEEDLDRILSLLGNTDD